jgi:predicted NUDIX family NTP pyrophosphohydrolase
MPRRSAGLLLYRAPSAPDGPEVLLVHPGGPLWARRPWASWSVPKGEVDDPDPEPSDEVLAATAEREFAEELGQAAPAGPRLDLGEVRQSGGKRVRAWAVAGDLDVSTVRSDTFTMPWPPGSGRTAEFPEVDEARWFGLTEAGRRIVAGQRPLLERLAEVVAR